MGTIGQPFGDCGDPTSEVVANAALVDASISWTTDSEDCPDKPGVKAEVRFCSLIETDQQPDDSTGCRTVTDNDDGWGTISASASAAGVADPFEDSYACTYYRTGGGAWKKDVCEHFGVVEPGG